MPFSRRLPITTCCALLVAAVPAKSETTCGSPPFDEPHAIAAIVSELKPAVSGFNGLFDTLTNTVHEICVTDTLVVARGYFEPDTRSIVIAQGLPRGLLQAVLVHELRHAEQYSQGLCPSLSLGMKDYAQAVFAMEADASVTNLVVAMHLRETGDSAMWDALAKWPMQADIADAFVETLTRTGDLPQAAHVAFDTWFANDRRTHTYYVSSCMDYLDQTEKQHLLPQYDRIAPDYLGLLCMLPDGAQYTCNVPDLP